MLSECSHQLCNQSAEAEDDSLCVQGLNSGRLQWKPPTEPDVHLAMVGQDAEARLLAERSKGMEARVWNHQQDMEARVRTFL